MVGWVGGVIGGGVVTVCCCLEHVLCTTRTRQRPITFEFGFDAECSLLINHPTQSFHHLSGQAIQNAKIQKKKSSALIHARNAAIQNACGSFTGTKL